MITKKEYWAAVQITNLYKIQVQAEYESIRKEHQEIGRAIHMPTKDTLVREADTSTRLRNVLYKYGLDDSKIGDLEKHKMSEIRKLKHCGEETIKELIDLCALCGFMIPE